MVVTKGMAISILLRLLAELVTGYLWNRSHAASYTDVSLSMRAKESGEGENGETSLDPLRFIASHTRVTRAFRARLPLCEKRRAWGGGWTPEQSWILDSTQWIPDFRNFVGGTWIPHSSSYRDSRLLELQSRLQSPGFRITQARIPRILDSISNNFLNTGIRIPTQGGN